MLQPRILKIMSLGLFVSSAMVSLVAEAGPGSTGGGVGFTCDGGKTVAMVDGYEALTHGHPILLGPSAASFQDKVSFALNRLKTIAPVRSQILTTFVADMYRNNVEWTSGALVNQSDFSGIDIPLGCQPLQIAFQRDDISVGLGERRYVFQVDLFNKMSSDDQAVLVLHEIVYRDLMGGRSPTGEHARLVTEELFSDLLNDITYGHEMAFGLFPIAEWNGLAAANWGVFGGVPAYLNPSMHKLNMRDTCDGDIGPLHLWSDSCSLALFDYITGKFDSISVSVSQNDLEQYQWVMNAIRDKSLCGLDLISSPQHLRFVYTATPQAEDSFQSLSNVSCHVNIAFREGGDLVLRDPVVSATLGDMYANTKGELAVVSNNQLQIPGYAIGRATVFYSADHRITEIDFVRSDMNGKFLNFNAVLKPTAQGRLCYTQIDACAETDPDLCPKIGDCW